MKTKAIRLISAAACFTGFVLAQASSASGIAAEGIYGVGVQLGYAEMGAFQNVDPTTLVQSLIYAHGLAQASGCIPVDEIDNLTAAMRVAGQSRALYPRISDYRQRLAKYIETHCNCAVTGSTRALPALAGAWIDDNQPASITQDSTNRLVFTNKRGQRSNGTFADSSTVIAMDWEGGLRGSLQDNNNTIRWANGTVWYRGAARSMPALAGAWSDDNRAASITQDANNRLVFTNKRGERSNGVFADSSTVIATDWEGGLRGSLQDNNNTIRWANGTVWYRRLR